MYKKLSIIKAIVWFHVLQNDPVTCLSFFSPSIHSNVMKSLESVILSPSIEDFKKSLLLIDDHLIKHFSSDYNSQKKYLHTSPFIITNEEIRYFSNLFLSILSNPLGNKHIKSLHIAHLLGILHDLYFSPLLPSLSYLSSSLLQEVHSNSRALLSSLSTIGHLAATHQVSKLFPLLDEIIHQFRCEPPISPTSPEVQSFFSSISSFLFPPPIPKHFSFSPILLEKKKQQISLCKHFISALGGEFIVSLYEEIQRKRVKGSLVYTGANNLFWGEILDQLSLLSLLSIPSIPSPPSLVSLPSISLSNAPINDASSTPPLLPSDGYLVTNEPFPYISSAEMSADQQPDHDMSFSSTSLAEAPPNVAENSEKSIEEFHLGELETPHLLDDNYRRPAIGPTLGRVSADISDQFIKKKHKGRNLLSLYPFYVFAVKFMDIYKIRGSFDSQCLRIQVPAIVPFSRSDDRERRQQVRDEGRDGDGSEERGDRRNKAGERRIRANYFVSTKPSSYCFIAQRNASETGTDITIHPLIPDAFLNINDSPTSPNSPLPLLSSLYKLFSPKRNISDTVLTKGSVEFSLEGYMESTQTGSAERHFFVPTGQMSFHFLRRFISRYQKALMEKLGEKGREKGGKEGKEKLLSQEREVELKRETILVDTTFSGPSNDEKKEMIEIGEGAVGWRVEGGVDAESKALIEKTVFASRVLREVFMKIVNFSIAGEKMEVWGQILMDLSKFANTSNSEYLVKILTKHNLFPSLIYPLYSAETQTENMLDGCKLDQKHLRAESLFILQEFCKFLTDIFTSSQPNATNHQNLHHHVKKLLFADSPSPLQILLPRTFALAPFYFYIKDSNTVIYPSRLQWKRDKTKKKQGYTIKLAPEVIPSLEKLGLHKKFVTDPTVRMGNIRYQNLMRDKNDLRLSRDSLAPNNDALVQYLEFREYCEQHLSHLHFSSSSSTFVPSISKDKKSSTLVGELLADSLQQGRRKEGEEVGVSGKRETGEVKIALDLLENLEFVGGETYGDDWHEILMKKRWQMKQRRVGARRVLLLLRVSARLIRANKPTKKAEKLVEKLNKISSRIKNFLLRSPTLASFTPDTRTTANNNFHLAYDQSPTNAEPVSLESLSSIFVNSPNTRIGMGKNRPNSIASIANRLRLNSLMSNHTRASSFSANPGSHRREGSFGTNGANTQIGSYANDRLNSASTRANTVVYNFPLPANLRPELDEKFAASRKKGLAEFEYLSRNIIDRNLRVPQKFDEKIRMFINKCSHYGSPSGSPSHLQIHQKCIEDLMEILLIASKFFASPIYFYSHRFMRMFAKSDAQSLHEIPESSEKESDVLAEKNENNTISPVGEQLADASTINPIKFFMRQKILSSKDWNILELKLEKIIEEARNLTELTGVVKRQRRARREEREKIITAAADELEREDERQDDTEGEGSDEGNGKDRNMETSVKEREMGEKVNPETSLQLTVKDVPKEETSPAWIDFVSSEIPRDSLVLPLGVTPLSRLAQLRNVKRGNPLKTPQNFRLRVWENKETDLELPTVGDEEREGEMMEMLKRGAAEMLRRGAAEERMEVVKRRSYSEDLSSTVIRNENLMIQRDGIADIPSLSILSPHQDLTSLASRLEIRRYENSHQNFLLGSNNDDYEDSSGPELDVSFSLNLTNDQEGLRRDEEEMTQEVPLTSLLRMKSGKVERLLSPRRLSSTLATATSSKKKAIDRMFQYGRALEFDGHLETSAGIAKEEARYPSPSPILDGILMYYGSQCLTLLETVKRRTYCEHFLHQFFGNLKKLYGVSLSSSLQKIVKQLLQLFSLSSPSNSSLDNLHQKDALLLTENFSDVLSFFRPEKGRENEAEKEGELEKRKREKEAEREKEREIEVAESVIEKGDMELAKKSAKLQEIVQEESPKEREETGRYGKVEVEKEERVRGGEKQRVAEITPEREGKEKREAAIKEMREKEVIGEITINKEISVTKEIVEDRQMGENREGEEKRGEVEGMKEEGDETRGTLTLVTLQKLKRFFPISRSFSPVYYLRLVEYIFDGLEQSAELITSIFDALNKSPVILASKMTLIPKEKSSQRDCDLMDYRSISSHLSRLFSTFSPASTHSAVSLYKYFDERDAASKNQPSQSLFFFSRLSENSCEQDIASKIAGAIVSLRLDKLDLLPFLSLDALLRTLPPSSIILPQIEVELHHRSRTRIEENVVEPVEEGEKGDIEERGRDEKESEQNRIKQLAAIEKKAKTLLETIVTRVRFFDEMESEEGDIEYGRVETVDKKGEGEIGERGGKGREFLLELLRSSLLIDKKFYCEPELVSNLYETGEFNIAETVADGKRPMFSLRSLRGDDVKTICEICGEKLMHTNLMAAGEKLLVRLESFTCLFTPFAITRILNEFEMHQKKVRTLEANDRNLSNDIQKHQESQQSYQKFKKYRVYEKRTIIDGGLMQRLDIIKNINESTFLSKIDQIEIFYHFILRPALIARLNVGPTLGRLSSNFIVSSSFSDIEKILEPAFSKGKSEEEKEKREEGDKTTEEQNKTTVGRTLFSVFNVLSPFNCDFLNSLHFLIILLAVILSAFLLFFLRAVFFHKPKKNILTPHFSPSPLPSPPPSPVYSPSFSPPTFINDNDSSSFPSLNLPPLSYNSSPSS